MSIEPPELEAARERPLKPHGLWVQPEAESAEDLAGFFVHWFFVTNWNASFFMCARNAELVWLEPKAVPARATTRAHFPGADL